MKGGTQPIILMVHLAVAWLCLASSAPLLPALSSENADAAVVLKTEYIKLNFSTASATPETYKSFIASVRAGLVSKADGSSSGIPVLVDEDDPFAIEAFLNITLVNKAGHSVSLKMDVARASFIAYDAGTYSCLLKRSVGSGTVSSAICYSDPWGSRRSWAVVTPPRSSSSSPRRDGLEVATWRVEDLDEAVSSLYLFPTGNATAEDLSRGVAACDMMVASAAAFPYIERRMSAGMWDGNGVADDPSLRGLAARWPWLSFAVQQSYQGAFAAPVPVQRSNGEWMHVDNVRRAVPLVSFLAYDTCNKSSSASSSSRLPMLIRSVVPEPDGGAPAAPCGQDEPTVRLVGPEGRCVDVPYGNYRNGKQVQLWSCKSAGDVNQLWTLKRDGTIRSNGKCLTSNGDAAGARVVVDECPAAPTSRAVWEVRADGTVALKGSPRDLVLAVTSSRLLAGLTVRADDRGTGQSWTPTNVTAPMAAAIVGFRDLCLQVSYAGAVSVAACRGGAGGVQWSLYPDGSVRPPAWLFLQWQCLAADASGRVTVGYCDGAGSACERWVFRSDGTILNTGTGKVLDVRACGSKQDCWEVVVSPASDGSPSPTQKWALML